MAQATTPASRQIDEVVVTAQKRVQSLQEVPIAVAAFSQEELKRTGAASLDQLTEFVVGAELYDDRGAGQPTWVIRGVGLADFNANNTPTAAIYYDEFYLASNAYGGIGLFDVERVEVLKGPQGGLYGRNTTGGAVRIVSARPGIGEDFNGGVSAKYGRWNEQNVQAAIGGPIGQKLAWRAALNYRAGGGWQDTLVTPEDDNWGDTDFLAGKASLAAELTDNFRIDLKVEAGRDSSETTLGYARAVYDLTTQDFCAAAYAGRYDPQSCATWYNVTQFSTHTPGDEGINPAAIKDDGTKVFSSPINEIDNDWFSATLNMGLELSSISLRFITGYIHYDYLQSFDYDASPLHMGEEQDSRTELASWFQEFRVQSADDDGLIWLVGASYAEDTDSEFRIFNALDNRLVLPVKGRRGFEQETKAWALFAQAEYPLTQSLRLNASLRYTDETKSLSNAFLKVDDAVVNGSPDLLGSDVIGSLLAAAAAEEYEGVNRNVSLGANWSGHVGIDWFIDDEMMAYAKVTRGFKSGGFFGGFALTRAELGPYFEETTTAIESGFKSTLLDKTLRLNLAAFTYDYKDIQGYMNTVNTFTGTVLSILGNVGDGRFYGAEIEAQWLPPFLSGLEIVAGLSWLDAKIKKAHTQGLNSAGEEYDLTGKRIPNAAEWSYMLSLNYETPLWSEYSLGASTIYSWRDDLMGPDSASAPLDLATVGRDAYGLLNARLFLRAADSGWELAISGSNLTNTEFWHTATTDGLGSFTSIPNRPTSWALEVAWHW